MEGKGGWEGGPEMPPVLLIGRVEPIRQSGTSYQCSPCTGPAGSSKMEGGNRERERERREAKTEREGECRATLRFLGCSHILTRNVSIASRFSAPAEKVQFS